MFSRNNSMSDFDKSFKRMQRLVFGFIAFVFALIVLYWIVIGVIVVKTATVASEQDYSGGIKPVIEKIWCGKPGCMDTTQ